MADQDEGTGNQGGIPNNQGQPQQGQGMQVNVTPQSPAAPGAYKPTPPGDLGKKKQFDFPHSKRLILIGCAIVIVLVLIGSIFLFVLPGYSITTTTTSIATTTVQTISASYLSSCGVINTPGMYYLSNSILYTQTSGACINVTASGVLITCNGLAITGSGPFTGTGPFSYGIVAYNNANFTVTGCTISNFSYGVYSHNVNGFAIKDNNVARNYVTSIYINGSSNGQVQDNLISNSTGPGGAIGLYNGSTNINVTNNTLQNNIFRGIIVNSSGNLFRNNTIIGSQYSFACSALDGFPKSNIALGNTCYNETGCDFVTCNGINAPANVTQILLTSAIASCGSIRFPGSYSISSNINMEDYSNLPPKALAAYEIPCITIASSNVNLNCNNHAITNAYIGIVVQGQNVNLENCTVDDSDTGVLFNGANTTTLSRSSFTNDTTGIQLSNSSAGAISNITEQGGIYGMYFQNTGTTSISNFSIDLNTYGIYMIDSLGNLFSKGSAIGNSKFDVFGDPLSANNSANLMSGSTCNITNTQWATCKIYIQNVSFITYPLSACTNIKRSGLYNMTHDILNAQNDCMNVQANNVTLNCEGYNITGPSIAQSGPAILVSGRKNVTVDNCGTYLFDDGAIVLNSTNIHLDKIKPQLSGSYGILLNNVTNAEINDSYVLYPDMAGIELNSSRNVLLYNNTMDQGRASDYGIYILNTSNSRILNNSGSQNYVGLQMSGQRSVNDTVLYNNFGTSGEYDYSCDQYSSSLFSNENGGINTGATKNGCDWMAVIPVGSSPLDCPLVTAPGFYLLHQDYQYGFGATCYSIKANDTTIDCNGHTILATSGGAFVAFNNIGTSSSLVGCNLKGFTTPVVAINSSISLVNDTIYENHTNLTALTPAVNVTFGQEFGMKDTAIKTDDVGLLLYNVTYGDIENNNVTGGIAYYLDKSDSIQLTDTTSSPGSGIGVYAVNSVNNVFMNNIFDGISYGLFCAGSAKSSINNSDTGGNYCSANNGCAWIDSSLLTCH